MKRLLILVTVVLGLSLAGCSLLAERLSGSGPTPDEYFDGAPAELAGGADPNLQNPHTGETPVTTVCLAGDVAALDLLAQAGADLGHQDRLGELALHTCARTNQGALILRMLELGVDPLASTSRGDTFQELYFGYNHDILSDRAIEQRHQIVAWLLAHGYPIIPQAERYR